MSIPSPLQIGLGKNPANYAPLTPLTLLEWSADVYPQQQSVVHGRRTFTWAQTHQRCLQLAAALARRGIGVGDTVAAMLPNIPEMYEMHFGVAMIGAVLNTLNTRLDADAIAFMLDHGEAKVLVTDREFSATIEPALGKVKNRPLVIDVDDIEYGGEGQRLGEFDYETFIDESTANFARRARAEPLVAQSDSGHAAWGRSQDAGRRAVASAHRALDPRRRGIGQRLDRCRDGNRSRASHRGWRNHPKGRRARPGTGDARGYPRSIHR